MATSGQIINILSKLDKGFKATEGAERTAKKKEVKQHKKMFLELGTKFSKAKRKGKKPAKFADMLSMAIALSGVGLPAALLSNLALKAVGGEIGRKKSQEYLKGITGFEGTKFSGDLAEYSENVGADFFTDALKDTAIQAMTAGTMKGLQGKFATEMPGKLGKSLRKASIALQKEPSTYGLSLGQAIKQEAGHRVKSFAGKVLEKGVDFGDFAGESIGKLLKRKTPLEQLAAGKSIKVGIPIIKGGEKTLGTNIAKALGATGTGNTLAQQLATQLYIGDKRKKQPSIYGYKLPEQMASPYFRG